MGGFHSVDKNLALVDGALAGDRLGQLLHGANADADPAHTVTIRGPMPPPIARIAEYHRQQIELIAADAATLHRLLNTLRNQRHLISDMHTAIDVDPVSLL
ncbi:MAG: hypothetical protein HC828_07550 [Blastochloris sp.]|nr:hypothetical protein [Blastochloris sp.]